MDTSVPEEDLWEGLKSECEVISFKRITIKKDDVVVPTRIVELKFLSPKLPRHISIYNMIFTVTPSVRSPVQCNKCLRFGHTSKFCRSSPRYGHCGQNNHLMDSCPSLHATEPCCIFCKLPHIATDRNCQEWSRQRDIKKVIATENLPFKEAQIFIKNKMYFSAFSYASIANKQPSSVPINVYPSIPEGDIHQIPQSNAFSKRKSRKRSPSIYKKHFNLPPQKNFSLLNGSALNYGLSEHNNNELSISSEDGLLNVSKNKNALKDNSFIDQSWVPKLANEITRSLNKTASHSSVSPDLYSVVVSSLLNFFSSSQYAEDDSH